MGTRKRKVEVTCLKCNGNGTILIDTWNQKRVSINCSACRGKGTTTEYQEEEE